jgi:hypothetical protein
VSPLRTLRPISLIASALLAVGVLAAPPAGAAVIVKPIVFPVDGVVTYTDTFGACRGTACERRHEGQDLMGKKMMRLVAAVDGTVLRLVFSNTSSGGNSVTIKGADGWTYHYIHVNNDTPGTDDGKATRAQAFPANIVVGARVTRGQLVAYMGDSGNAETTSPHLHFEIRQPPPPGGYTGVAINAYPSLQAASPATSAPAKWYLRTAPSTGGSKYSFAYGLRTDQALLCDWDADGLDEPVIYRAGTWYLRTGVNDAATARKITFGTAADIAQCADLDGDGIDEPALFQNGTWTVRTGFEATGSVTWTGVYGTTGDRPVLGDWDGNGSDDLGVYRGNAWYLRSTGAAPGGTVHHYAYGRSTDLPVAADWDGDGADSPAVFRAGTWFAKVAASSVAESLPAFVYGTSGDQPLAGVWEPTTSTNIGVYRPGH